LFSKLITLLLIISSKPAYSKEEAKSIPLPQEYCFNYLYDFQSENLELIFSKCLYACYNKYEECPSTEEPPGRVCRDLLSYVQYVAAENFKNCTLDVQKNQLKINQELYKKYE
jgi:hypothetical protein